MSYKLHDKYDTQWETMEKRVKPQLNSVEEEILADLWWDLIGEHSDQEIIEWEETIQEFVNKKNTRKVIHAIHANFKRFKQQYHLKGKNITATHFVKGEAYDQTDTGNSYEIYGTF